MNANREQKVRELYESWTRAEMSFRMKMMPELKGIDFGVPQLEILFALNYSKEQRASVKELVNLTKKSSSAITQLTEGLEKEGYVERRHSTGDRRVVFVHLKEEGEEKFAVFYSSLIESIGKMTQSLTDNEIEEYIRINNKLTKQI